MTNYSSFDYLCNEPFFIEGIGNVKCPTLRDIRKIKYRVFTLYINILTMSLETYLKTSNTLSEYQKLSSVQQADFTLYNVLVISSSQLLQELISFFINGTAVFDVDTLSFSIYEDHDDEKMLVGNIDNNNFEIFQTEIQRILGLKNPEQKQPAFKNDYARQLYEMFQSNEQNIKKNSDENYEIDNMILKFCTHNKTGINILNVWDMTYYQFSVMFREYNIARQYDYYDCMAANTFSFKKSSDYKPMDYMKKF